VICTSRRRWGRVRRAIGVVAQKSGADPVATGRENLLLQGSLYGMRGAAVQRRADELLDRFDLADAGKRQVKGSSGGMQRRLDVALGLRSPTRWGCWSAGASRSSVSTRSCCCR
jgi:ABC-type multidrug transport system ATPase subunit